MLGSSPHSPKITTHLDKRVVSERYGSEAGSYLRSIDSCITQLKAQAPSMTCNESQEEEEEEEEEDKV